MVHVADPAYYDRVTADLSRCRYLLLEGVDWRRHSGRHRPLYDLLAKNLGLAAQETAVRYPNDAKKVNLDMPRSEFRRKLLQLPIKDILIVIFLRRILWLLTLPKALRTQFTRRAFLRKKQPRRSEDEQPLQGLILTARDKRIVENLRDFHQGNASVREKVFTGVVFGARHMPAICVALHELGYGPGARRWVEVFRRKTESLGTAVSGGKR